MKLNSFDHVLDSVRSSPDILKKIAECKKLSILNLDFINMASINEEEKVLIPVVTQLILSNKTKCSSLRPKVCVTNVPSARADNRPIFQDVLGRVSDSFPNLKLLSVHSYHRPWLDEDLFAVSAVSSSLVVFKIDGIDMGSMCIDVVPLVLGLCPNLRHLIIRANTKLSTNPPRLSGTGSSLL